MKQVTTNMQIVIIVVAIEKPPKDDHFGNKGRTARADPGKGGGGGGGE